MQKTKIQLSADELRLMQDSAWILTKNSVIEKLNQGLGELATRMQQHLAACQPSLATEVQVAGPKISKGEKYEGLPYLILDYPRVFGKTDILAIRTLFWWGNYFSVTLHVKGCWQELVTQNITADPAIRLLEGFYASSNGDEWSHNLESNSYKKIDGWKDGHIGKGWQRAAFLKIASRVELGPWDQVEEKLFERFTMLSALVTG